MGKTETNEAWDDVNHPSWYADGKIEVIDFIEDRGFGAAYCLGNAIKYIARAGRKDPEKEVQDLKKAVWYINRRIQEIEKEHAEGTRGQSSEYHNT